MQHIFAKTSALVFILLIEICNAQQTIQNPGFETWNKNNIDSVLLPDYWGTYHTIALKKVVLQSTDAHSGQFAVELKMDSSGQYGGSVLQYAIVPGTTLQLFSFWMKPHLTGKGTIEVYIQLQADTTVGYYATFDSGIALHDSSLIWKQFTVPLKILHPGTHASGGWVQFNLNNGDTDSYALIDDVALVDTLHDGVNKVTNAEAGLIIFPNPGSDIAFAEYSVKTNSMVKLLLYDATGKALQTIVNTYQSARRYRAEIPVAGLPAGSYIVQLAINDNVTEVKFIKQLR